MPQQRLGRTWGTRFDSLTSSDSLSSNPDSIASSQRAPSPPRSTSADESNNAQDASIFIGSLPSNMDYAELTSMLSQHLSQHPQVKGIKVVRDSKGGACAFIQCQDSEAASVLMNNLHVAAPQPFLGRYLRYEPARAFRTLLISYRSPRQYSRPRDFSRKPNYLPAQDTHFIELPLPNAMRITKTSGSKHFTILFNSNALETPPNGAADPGLLLVPLFYDEKIASVFGTIDSFGPSTHGNENSQASISFLPPHDAPRSPVMDPGCWKVKWTHRDDCVCALMTLRRIPHLTITWAHQSNIVPRESGFYNNPSVVQASHSWRSRGAGPPLHSAPNFLSTSHTFPAIRTIEKPSIAERPFDVNIVDPSPDCKAWQSELAADNSSTLHSRASRPRALSLTHDRPQSAVSLSSRESTGQPSFTNWESTNRTRWVDHIESIGFGSPSLVGPNLVSSPYLGGYITSSDSSYHTSREGDKQEPDASISHTPDFGTSPRTPASLMLRTPAVSSMGDFQSVSFGDCDSQSSLRQLSQDHVVDPTTIFVGGLEMFGPNAWDEGKVRTVFSKYGGIEAIKVIRPNNKRSAFAFVKFNNTESPARAVKAEHNRMVDGRLIRVQLRDWNPAYRHSWRPNKGLNSQPLGASLVPKLPEPGTDNISAHMADLQLTDSLAQPAPSSPSEACYLDEVQNETGVPTSEIPSTDDSQCDPIKEAHGMEKSPNIKQSGPIPPDTIPMSSQASTMPVATLPGAYSAPTIQFYQGWIPNYAPQFPFQVPFAGQPYPGYPFSPPIIPPPLPNGGSDGSGTPPFPPIAIGPVTAAYPTFMPYPPPPSHGSDAGQTAIVHHGVSNNPTLLHAQAPLIPTGFIHGDQGMLVPVYPPDALNQYMAGNQDQGQPEGQSAANWRAYPLPPIRPQAIIFHPFINPPPTGPPPHPLGTHAWIPNQTWHGAPPQPGNGHGIPNHRISSPIGGPAPFQIGTNFDRNLVPPRRQYRRDNHSYHHKNNFVRGMAGRFAKASFEAPRSSQDIPPASVPQAVSDMSIDTNWQGWNTDQSNSA